MANGFVRQAQFTTTSATITGAASGNTLVLYIAAVRSSGARTVSSLSCTNVTWTKLCGTTSASGGVDSEIWYGVVSGGTSGTSVSITMSGTGSTICGTIAEYSGVLTASQTDGTAQTGTNSSTSPSVSGLTASLANDLIVACAGYANGTAPSAQPGGSYANLTFANNSTTIGCQANYILAGSSGAQSASWTITSAAWVACLGALKVSPQTKTLTSATTALSATAARTPQKPQAASTTALSATSIKVPGKAVSAATVAEGASITKLIKKVVNANPGAFSNGYLVQAVLTIDHTKCGSSDSSNFPVLVYISDSRLKTVSNGGLVSNTGTQSGGNSVTIPIDLIFTSDSSGVTKIPWEIDFYDGTNGVLWAWVKISTVSHTSDTTFYCWFGSSAINTQQNTGSVSVANVWTNSFAAVYHFPDGTTLSLKDSTSNANNGTNVNSVAAGSGQIDGSAVFSSASSKYVDIGNDASVQITGNLTISAWVKLASSPSPAADYQVVAKDNSSGGRAYTLDISKQTGSSYGVSGIIPRFYINGGGATDSNGSNIVGSTVNISVGTWTQVCGVYNTSGTLDMYVNGSSSRTQRTGESTSIPSATCNTRIGARQYSGFEEYFDGSIDEVRIQSASRSADWILTEYNNQNSPSTFLTVSISQASAVSAILSLLRPLSQSFSAATAACSALIAKLAAKPQVAASTAASGSVSRQDSKPLSSSTVAQSAGVSRVDNKTLGAATTSLSATLVRGWQFAASTVAQAASILKRTSKSQASSTASSSGSVSKVVSKVQASSTQAQTASISRVAQLPESASTTSPIGSVSNKTSKGLSAASATVSGAISRLTSALKSAATTAQSALVVKRLSRSQAATSAAPLGSIAKMGEKGVSAATAAWSATISFAGRVLTQSFNAVTTALSAAVSKLTSKQSPAAPAQFSGALNKGSYKTASAATVGQSGVVAKTTNKSTIAATATMAAVLGMQKFANLVLTAATSTVSAAVSKLTSKRLVSNTATVAGSVVKFSAKPITSSTLATSGSTNNRTIRGIDAATNSVAGALNKVTARSLSAASAAFGAVVTKLLSLGIPDFSKTIHTYARKLLRLVVVSKPKRMVTAAYVTRTLKASEMQAVLFEKYTTDSEYFGLDWSERGASTSDPIVVSDWTVPNGLVKGTDAFTNTTTQVKLSGGTAGQSYTITNVITTQSGQSKTCKVILKVS